MDAWMHALVDWLAELRTRQEGRGYQELLELLREARRQSGLTRIGFDNRVRALGVNVISLRVHGSEDELRAAISTGEDASARGQHHDIPWEVKTACLIHL